MVGGKPVTSSLVLVVGWILIMGPLLCQNPKPDWEGVERLRKEEKFQEALARVREWKKQPSDLTERLKIVGTEQQLLHDLSRFPEAQQAGREWIRLAEQAGDTRSLVQAHRQTGLSFLALRKNEAAAQHLRLALQRVSSLGDSGLRLAIVLDLAGAETNLANYPASETLLKQAEAFWQETRDPVAGARLWSQWGTLTGFMGDEPEALRYRQKALELARQTGRQSLLTSALSNLGMAQMNLHNYAEALTYLGQALEGKPKLFERARALMNIGICQFELNRFEPAIRSFEQALQIAMQLRSIALESWATGEIGLAVWKSERAADRAIRHFDRAIELCRKGKDPRNELVWATNRAMVRREQGRYAESLELYREVERRTAQIPGLRLNATVHKSMGQCLAALGRYREAEELLQKAVEESRAVGDSKRTWEAYHELAKLYRQTRRHLQADHSFQSALKTIESMRQSLRLDAFKADFFQDKVQVYQDYIDFSASFSGGDDPAVRAFEVAERSRARSFLDSLSESRALLHETLPAETVQREKEILSQISSLQAEIHSREATPELNRRLAEKEKELEGFYLQLRSRYPRFREMRYPEPARLNAIQQALKPDEVLLEYSIGEAASHL